jgi:hypothetical protein
VAVEGGEIVALASAVALLVGDVGETVVFHSLLINELILSKLFRLIGIREWGEDYFVWVKVRGVFGFLIVWIGLY